MNAKEAREKSLQITGDKEKNQYEEIKKIIAKTVDNGGLHCQYYSPLKPAVKIQLETEGYGISEFHCQKDGTTVTIKW